MNIINNDVTEYIDSLYRPLNKKMLEFRKVSEDEHIPIILKDTETLLLNIIRIKNPKRILEIGTAVGYSASCFACAKENTEIVSIEADEEMYERALENIRKLGYENRISVKLGKAEDVLSELKDYVFDMVFIDASKSHYREFWDLSLPLLTKDALIISDNVLLKAGTASDLYDPKKRFKTSIRKMREYLRYITDLDYADTSVLPVGDGVAVSVLNIK